MSGGWIAALELLLVLGVVLGLAVWDLVRLRRDRDRDAGRDNGTEREGGI